MPAFAGMTMANGSLRAFYRDMTVPERRTFWACFWGWLLDGMDFMIYPLVIGTVVSLWQIERAEAGFAVTLTLLFSAIGGWAAGYLSDRIGRVRTLQLTILWFSAFSLLCAFAQDFTQLMICRALLGLGFGGEWAAGAVLIGETVRAEYRGRAGGGVQSGWALGWGLAVLLQALLFSMLPPEQAWRWLFAFGAAPALLVFYIRRNVQEPALRRRHGAATGPAARIWEIFAPDILPTTLLAALLGIGAQGGYYAIATWLPSFLHGERGLTVVGSAGYLAFVIAGAFVGYLVGAWLADRLGRRVVFQSYAVAAALLVIAYTQLRISPGLMLVLGFPLGFFSSGYFSGFGAFLTELFPTRLRGSGLGFAYNFGRGIGALFPTMVGVLSASLSLAHAMALFALLAYTLMFTAATLLPETRGKILE